jgi:hypothetical protein
MVAQVLTAYLHFLGIMTLMATLLAEHVILQPNMTRLHMQRLVITDLVYGITAGIVLITGLLRFAYFGKGIPLVVCLGAAGNSDGPVRSRSRRVNQPVSASQIRVPEPDVTLSACQRAHPARIVFR